MNKAVADIILVILLCGHHALAASESNLQRRANRTFTVARHRYLLAKPSATDKVGDTPDPWERARWTTNELWVRFCGTSTKEGKMCFLYIQAKDTPLSPDKLGKTCVQPKANMQKPVLIANDLSASTLVRWYWQDMGPGSSIRTWEYQDTAHGFEFDGCEPAEGSRSPSRDPGALLRGSGEEGLGDDGRGERPSPAKP